MIEKTIQTGRRSLYDRLFIIAIDLLALGSGVGQEFVEQLFEKAVRIMQFELASHEQDRVFAAWSEFSRLEERTCRPILNGKRVPPSNKIVTFSFVMDGIDELVGRFAYFDINDRNHSAEFGYMVNPKFRQQGIGTEMLNTAITHLFSSTALNKLYCQTAAFNIPSIKLLEKLNFHQDGMLREHHELDRKLWDDYIYSILRREWKKV